MVIKFPFKKSHSRIFGDIWRPMAKVIFTSPNNENIKQAIWLLVDSGADYTLLPRYLGYDLNIDFEKDCQVFHTTGIGGTEKVYLLPKIKVQLGEWQKEIPIGFLDRNEVPPLMGRHLFMETIEIYFSSDHITYFSNQPFRQ